jgi:phage regulator Rha-like protein
MEKKNEAGNLLPNHGDTMSSREIAELTGKRHTEVLRAIRTMEAAWERISGRKFALADYTDAQGKPRSMYQLTKTECLYVATKFNDEARAKLVIRWEQLETHNASQLDQLTTAMIRLTETFTGITNLISERLTRLENQALPAAGPIKITQPEGKPDYIDVRLQEYDFVKVNHFNIRRIVVDEVVYYSINDFCHAIQANTSAHQIARKLNKQRPIAFKIWIFGNTMPAWFTTKNGIRIIVSGSRTLRDDHNIKLELRRALA